MTKKPGKLLKFDSSQRRAAAPGDDGSPATTVPAELVHHLQKASRILIFTGTGIANGNNLPEYHSRPQWSWFHRQQVFYKDFIHSEAVQIAYWETKIKDRDTNRGIYPNAAHKAIVKLEQAEKLEMVVTQNVDGLQNWAGTSPTRLVELNGSNAEVECLNCHLRSDPHPHFEYFRKYRTPPRCSCGGIIKPATISFGQNLREDDLHRAAMAAASADLVLVLGSCLSVYPAASIPLLASQRGIPYIIIHQSRTHHDDHPKVTLRLHHSALEIFPPAVDQALHGSRS